MPHYLSKQLYKDLYKSDESELHAEADRGTHVIWMPIGTHSLQASCACGPRPPPHIDELHAAPHENDTGTGTGTDTGMVAWLRHRRCHMYSAAFN
jgi:hypothetical protein